MDQRSLQYLLFGSGEAEADETFICGLEKNEHAADKKLNAGRGTVGRATMMDILDNGNRTAKSTVYAK